MSQETKPMIYGKSNAGDRPWGEVIHSIRYFQKDDSVP